MSHVFIVEDDLDQSDLLAYSLTKAGYQVETAQTAAEALDKLRRFEPDVVIMDVMLPDATGFELCKRLMQISPAPIVLVSAVRISEEDRVNGLNCGARDYLAKSHSHRELLLRVQKLLSTGSGNTVISVLLGARRLQVFLLDQRVLLDEEEIRLTSTEFKLLAALAKTPGRIVSYKELSLYIWGFPSADSTMLKTSFSRLKSKFKNRLNRLDNEIFHTFVREGYALVPSVEKAPVSSTQQ